MKKIYKFHADCGRMGHLESIFVAEEEEVKDVIGRDVYFGEVLGKHSEVGGVIEENEITVLSDDQDFVKKFIEIMGDGTISGHNPLDYYEGDDEKEEEEG